MSAEPSALLSVIRPMREQDIEAVLVVEEAAYRFPWSYNIFRDCIRMGYDCAVQLAADRIVGHLILSYGAGEAHVLNLAVDPDFQNRGYGGRLLRRSIRQAERYGSEAIFLEVRPSNPPAMTLYRHAGFRLAGRRRDYYPCDEGREDALVMRLDLRAGARGSPCG